MRRGLYKHKSDELDPIWPYLFIATGIMLGSQLFSFWTIGIHDEVNWVGLSTLLVAAVVMSYFILRFFIQMSFPERGGTELWIVMIAYSSLSFCAYWILKIVYSDTLYYPVAAGGVYLTLWLLYTLPVFIGCNRIANRRIQEVEDNRKKVKEKIMEDVEKIRDGESTFGDLFEHIYESGYWGIYQSAAMEVAIREYKKESVDFMSKDFEKYVKRVRGIKDKPRWVYFPVFGK